MDNENNKKSFLKNPSKCISLLWSKLTVIKKICFSVIIIVIIGGIIFLLLPTSSMEMVFYTPIRDKITLDRAVMRIKQEGVEVSVTHSGLIKVADVETARQMRGILIMEDLIPTLTEVNDIKQHKITDLVLYRARDQIVTDWIKSIDGIEDAYVTISFPTPKLPKIASVIIAPNIESDITSNRKKIEIIQKVIKLSVEGIDDENIVIVDQNGSILNNF